MSIINGVCVIVFDTAIVVVVFVNTFDSLVGTQCVDGSFTWMLMQQGRQLVSLRWPSAEPIYKALSDMGTFFLTHVTTFMSLMVMQIRAYNHPW